VKQLGNPIVIVNIFYNLPPHADSEPAEESMGLSDWAKPFVNRVAISVNNVKHDSERAWVKPTSIASEAKANDFGASRC
jgi:hypothetical protein